MNWEKQARLAATRSGALGGSAPLRVAANPRRDRFIEAVVVLAAVVIAALSVRAFAFGANDKSRLATVECLVDHHTLTIDRSIWFGQTCDKIRPRPDGLFYSDKPPVLALMLAVLYQALHSAFGLSAAANNEVFCYLLTLASCGVAYVVAVWCVYRLGRALGLSSGWAAALAANFGLATIAFAYVRHLNSGLPTLAAAAAILLNLTGLTRSPQAKGMTGRLLLIGVLAGFAYALDQPTGGLLLAAAAVAAVARLRRPSAVVWVGLAALPWVVLHHAVVYDYAGTLGPPNSNPAYFDYPGSLFNAGNLTGRWNHASLGDFAAYAFLMLFGVQGFVLSNPPLLLALPAAVWSLRRPSDRRVETICFGLWGLGAWLAYATLSTNYGGQCCSIRWFVPLLAPAYFWLALLLRDCPQFRIDFIVLSAWGAVLAGYFWYWGPFAAYDSQPFFPYFFWSATAAGLLTWAACRARAATGAAPRR